MKRLFRKKTSYLTRLGAVILLFCFIWGSDQKTAMAAPRVQPTEEKIVIVIDPGHGGKNEGTIENGFLEKSMTLTTALAMYEELCKYDNVEVYLTRTEDVHMTLEERAEFAASVNADFLFSIHYNASLNHELYGSEVWIPLDPPYYAYGYQFGCVQMETMQDMGLFLRGVKTRVGDKGDYYGIIRESVAVSVPAVIIEHCHVDHEQDVPFCDTQEDLIAFGKADALSVAKYFGLKSSSLQVDYSQDSTALAEVSQNERVQLTLTDESEPDICQITLKDTDSSTGQVTFEISAADYDSMLLYYDYSLDGGETYSPRQPWPGCNIFDGTYTDTFSASFTIPSGEKPAVIVRAYNLFDLYTESNAVAFANTFLYGEDQEEAVAAAGQAAEGETPPDETKVSGPGEKKSLGTTTFRPDTSLEEPADKEVGLFDFLKICLVIVVILLVIVLASQIIADRRRRKRRRQRRKDPGDRNSQHR